jgi:SAM-dependent methyltransferase
MSQPVGTSAFGPVAAEYDDAFTHSAIGLAQRASVWLEADREFQPWQRILEINCGTGFDALHLAERGVEVVGCDAAPEMIDVARRRFEQTPFQGRADFQVLPTELISRLRANGGFDGCLSNFAGLNCVADLTGAARDLSELMKPGGKLILCVFGRTCLWEMAWWGLHGNFRKALRRLTRRGLGAGLGHGSTVVVYYPSLAAWREAFAPYFRLARWKGVGVVVPPTYLEPWAQRFPRLFQVAVKVDRYAGSTPGIRALADHAVLVLERTSA